MPKQTKKQIEEANLNQFIEDAEQYVKKYPEELMKLLEEVSKRAVFTITIENGEFNIYYSDNGGKIEKQLLPYAITVPTKERIGYFKQTPTTYIPYHCEPLEYLKEIIIKLKKEESEKVIRQNKIKNALDKLTNEEIQLLNINLNN